MTHETIKSGIDEGNLGSIFIPSRQNHNEITGKIRVNVIKPFGSSTNKSH